MMAMEVRLGVKGHRQLKRRITTLERRIEKELPDKTGFKAINAVYRDILKFMRLNDIQDVTGELAASLAPRKDKHGVWVISPEGMHTSLTSRRALTNMQLASILEFGNQFTGHHFFPKVGFGKQSEGFMSPGGSHTIRPKHFIEQGVNEGKVKATAIADNDVSKLIRKVFR